MTQIIWSPQALRDIEAIRTYIAEDSPRVAELVVGRIIKAVERLKAFPESGRKVPERNDPKIREVIESPYRVVYRVRTGTVEIVTVFRGSRPLPGLR
ncbi:MAG: type II toxin-antitoxin system RelE/ParE family toxin [Acidobacteria bacterium]|nr:type II toxin-antitoxin system RelE/ParE family toxin [Acidobacteriota bacterium]